MIHHFHTTPSAHQNISVLLNAHPPPSEMIYKVFPLVECLPLFFFQSIVFFPQSYIAKLALVREGSFRVIQKTNTNYILFHLIKDILPG